MFRQPLQFTIGLLVCLNLWAPPVAFAQESDAPPKIRGKVIGRLWHTNVSGGQFFRYTSDLTKELELPTSPIMMMIGGGRMGSELISSMNRNPSDGERQTSGTLIFLESFPQPGTPRLISFQSVANQEEYLKLVKERSGENELIGDKDRHESRMTLNFSSVVGGSLDGDVEGKKEGGPEKRSFSISISIDSSGSSEVSSGPAKMPEGPMIISTFYRYHDGFMYTSQLEALHTINLPSGKSLSLSDEEAATDIRAKIDLREIPKRLKDQLWAGLQSKALTYLQRFDNENPEEHAMRSAVGKGRLELFKAAMFDLDQIEFSLKLASQPTQPIEFQLEAVAREESQLAATLAALSSKPSRLTTLRDADSPLMLSTTFSIPEWMQPLAVSFVNSLQAKMKEDSDASVESIIDQLFQPIQETLSKELIDSVVRMDGTASTGATLLGGVRLSNAAAFQTALETLLVVGPASERYQVGQSTVGHRTVLTLSTSAEFQGGKKNVPVTVHLAGHDGYLWFAVGGATSLEVLQDHLESLDSGAHGQTGPARPLELRLSLSKWLGGEEDQFSDLPAQVLQQLERTLSGVFNRGSKMSMTVNGKVQEIGRKDEFESYAEKVLTPTGSDVDLKVAASGRKLTASATLGTQVVKFLVAQYVAATNRMFSGLKLQLPGMDQLDGKGSSIKAITLPR